MRKIAIFLLVPILFLFVGCSSNSSFTNSPSTTNTETPSQTEEPNTSTNDEVNDKYMYATINNAVLEIKLENNSSVEAMLEKTKRW